MTRIIPKFMIFIKIGEILNPPKFILNPRKITKNDKNTMDKENTNRNRPSIFILSL